MTVRTYQLARTLTSAATTTMRSNVLFSWGRYLARPAFAPFNSSSLHTSHINHPPRTLLHALQGYARPSHTSAPSSAAPSSAGETVEGDETTHEAPFKCKSRDPGLEDQYLLLLKDQQSESVYETQVEEIERRIKIGYEQQPTGHASAEDDAKASATLRDDDKPSMVTHRAKDLAQREPPRVVGVYVIPDVAANLALAGFTPRFECLLEQLNDLPYVANIYPQARMTLADHSPIITTPDITREPTLEPPKSISSATVPIADQSSTQRWPLCHVLKNPLDFPACEDLYAYVIDEPVDDKHPYLEGVKVEHGQDCTLHFKRGKQPGPRSTILATHGTKVASLITGKRGLAKGATIVSVKIFEPGAENTGDWFNPVLNTLRWVEQDIVAQKRQGKAVVNMSCGMSFYTGAGHQPMMKTLDNHFARLNELRTLCIVASGNDAHDVSWTWPACSEQVLTVGAIGEANEECDFSNRGPSVDLFAPGDRIPFDGHSLRGTSFASPIVAALALGFMSIAAGTKNNLSVAQIRNALTAAALKDVIALRQPSQNLPANFDFLTARTMLGTNK